MTRELCVMACVFCRDPLFQRWAGLRARAERYLFTACDMSCDSETLAKLYILAKCVVTSRNELDTNPDAAKRFHDEIRKPFMEWREQQ